MDIWYWRYELVPRRRLSAIAADGARQGALIRVSDGFADVHPWPELGDAAVDQQLDLLRRGETSALTRRSLSLAAIDAEARRRARSLFEGLTVPPSHWPLAGGDVPSAFDTVKVKMSPHSALDASLAHYRLRLDFNAALDAGAFLSFIESLSPEIRGAIDFVEDPCPYDPQVWTGLRERAGVRLALDRGDASAGVDVLVVKPAVQGLPRSEKEIVITSYMDHPLGQLGAAYVAAANGITATCGLATHVLFESDAFIERMKLDGTRLIPPAGAGLGFDDLLESLPWKRLG
jgi:O-succinylbenzoate synthase